MADHPALTPERRRARIRYADAVASMRWPAMLTLTRAPRPNPATVDAMRDTMRAFARLRRTKAFQGVRGGIAVLEVEGGGDKWHDHIHAVIDAAWLPIPPLVAAWRRTLRAPGSIHVMRLHAPARALAYVTKPQPPAYTAAMRTGRLVTAWGSCRV